MMAVLPQGLSFKFLLLQCLEFDAVLPGVLLRIASGGDVDGQAVASLESVLPNFRDTLRDRHTLKASAAKEGPLPDFRNALRNGHALKTRAAKKGNLSDFRDSLRNGYTLKARTAIKGHKPDFRDALRDGYTGQT